MQSFEWSNMELMRNSFATVLVTVHLCSAIAPVPHPPFMVNQPPHKQLYEVDRPFSLVCEADGKPEPTYRWIKNGKEFDLLSFGERISQQPGTGILVFTKPEDVDEGLYQCFADNVYGTSVSNAVILSKSAAPYWIIAPNNSNKAEEETVEFKCEAKGIPEPRVQWFVNGIPIEKVPANNRRKVNGSVLRIVDLIKTDTAVYQCNASNVHGYAFRDFYLNVLGLPPAIAEPPQRVTRAVVSSVVTLTCRVFGSPKPEVTWMRDGHRLTGDRYETLHSGDLKIRDTLFTDQGDYTCYATNKFGDVAATGKLEVKEKTKIDFPPEDYEVAAGRSATFRCNPVADPSLELTLEWLFNEQPIDFDQEPRMVKTADYSLTITKTMELDSGVYTCVARTELDEDTAHATLTVQDVPTAPRIVSVGCNRLNAHVEWVPTGDNRAPILSYSIEQNTNFTPDVWEDAFVNIPATDSKFIVSMSPWANYTFRVIARNKIGPSAASGPSEKCTTPEDVPYKNPENVAGYGTKPDNLIISWTPMPLIEQNAPDFFYKVIWKRQDIPDMQWESRQISQWEPSQMVIQDQQTYKPYRIKVEAHNRRGQAHTAAMEITGFSGEDVPLDAPQNFQLLSIKDTKSATFSWDPVTTESVRGRLKGYKIQTWIPEEGESQFRELIVAGNVAQALVTIFRPYSSNFVRVRAFNQLYSGPASDAIEFKTPEGVPGPVESFEAIPMGSSALHLTWKKPSEPNGVLIGYRIYYNAVLGTQLDHVERYLRISDPDETRTNLTDLRPNTKYRVTIQATTVTGHGDSYFIEITTNKESETATDEPNSSWTQLPHEVKASLKVSRMPGDNGHPANFYVQFKKKGDYQWITTPKVGSEDLDVIRGLELDQVYEIKVVSGDGP